MTARHESVLRGLLPFSIEGADPAFLAADAALLDLIQDRIEEVSKERFVSSSTLLGHWEAVYGVASAGTDSERKLRIIAAIQASGGLSRAFFIDLASSMGFAISIDDGLVPFRAGVSGAGEPVRDVNSRNISSPPDWDLAFQGPYPPDLWIWTVRVGSIGSNANSDSLKSAFLLLRPATTLICWIEGSSNLLLGAS